MSDNPPRLDTLRRLLSPVYCEDTCFEIAHTWTPSCFQGSFSVFRSVMQESFKIYPPLYLVAAILRKEKFEYFFLKFFQDIFLSSLAIAINGGGFVAGVCFTRKVLGRFYLLSMAFVPALLASFAAINVERKERQGILALYMFNNAVEMVYNMLKKRCLISGIPFGEVWLFCLTTAVMMYLYRKEDGLKRGAVKSLISFFLGTKKPEDVLPAVSTIDSQHRNVNEIVQEISIDCIQQSLKAFTIGYCLQLFTNLPRALRHPRLIPKIFSNPDNLKCGLFLAGQVGIFKIVEYLLTSYRKKQDGITSLLAGGLSGLSMMFYRSSTIALYLASKIGEIVYKRGIKQGIVPRIPHAKILIYSLCTAMVFHGACFEVDAIRPSYWKYLNQVTHKRFCEINRQKLGDVFDIDCAKYFPPHDRYMTLRS